jgi:hypothetical protein
MYIITLIRRNHDQIYFNRMINVDDGNVVVEGEGEEG